MHINPITTQCYTRKESGFKAAMPKKRLGNLSRNRDFSSAANELNGIPNITGGILRKYLQEISTIPLLSADEEFEIAQKAIGKNDANAKQKLIKSNLRFVINVALKHIKKGLPLADLIEEGNIGLMKAADTFDYTRGVKFITHAVWKIDEAIRLALKENSRTIRLPGHIYSLMYNINNTTRDLSQEFQREPANDEIATEMNISEKEIGFIRDSAQFIASLDEPVGPENDSKKIIEIFPSEPIGISRGLDKTQEDLLDLIERNMEHLSSMEKEVLTLRFGLNNEISRTKCEIASMYDTSEEEIAEIEKQAVENLRKYCNIRYRRI